MRLQTGIGRDIASLVSTAALALLAAPSSGCACTLVGYYNGLFADVAWDGTLADGQYHMVLEVDGVTHTVPFLVNGGTATCPALEEPCFYSAPSGGQNLVVELSVRTELNGAALWVYYGELLTAGGEGPD